MKQFDDFPALVREAEARSAIGATTYFWQELRKDGLVPEPVFTKGKHSRYYRKADLVPALLYLVQGHE